MYKSYGGKQRSTKREFERKFAKGDFIQFMSGQTTFGYFHIFSLNTPRAYRLIFHISVSFEQEKVVSVQKQLTMIKFIC